MLGILQNLLNFSRNGTGEEKKREGALKLSSRFHPSPASVRNPSHRVLIIRHYIVETCIMLLAQKRTFLKAHTNMDSLKLFIAKDYFITVVRIFCNFA